MKPGWKTTEFWVAVLTALSSLGGVAAKLVPGTGGVIAAGIAAAAYALSRGIAKN